jgi:polar amino acid transport system substrate-binding protein
MTCVTAENRIPQLLAKKVDLLVATLGVTAERARVIDFTKGYNWGGGDLLMFKDAPITKLADLNGKTVASLKGSTQAAWLEAKMPEVEVLRLNSVSDALQSLKQHRVVGVAVDKATVVVIASRDPEMRLLGVPFAVTEGAIGVRKNEPEWLAFLNAALVKMRAENMYIPWIEKWVPVTGNREFYITAFTTTPQLGD